MFLFPMDHDSSSVGSQLDRPQQLSTTAASAHDQKSSHSSSSRASESEPWDAQRDNETTPSFSSPQDTDQLITRAAVSPPSSPRLGETNQQGDEILWKGRLLYDSTWVEEASDRFCPPDRKRYLKKARHRNANCCRCCETINWEDHYTQVLSNGKLTIFEDIKVLGEVEYTEFFTVNIQGATVDTVQEQPAGLDEDSIELTLPSGGSTGVILMLTNPEQDRGYIARAFRKGASQSRRYASRLIKVNSETTDGTSPVTPMGSYSVEAYTAPATNPNSGEEPHISAKNETKEASLVKKTSERSKRAITTSESARMTTVSQSFHTSKQQAKLDSKNSTTIEAVERESHKESPKETESKESSHAPSEQCETKRQSNLSHKNWNTESIDNEGGNHGTSINNESAKYSAEMETRDQWSETIESDRSSRSLNVLHKEGELCILGRKSTGDYAWVRRHCICSPGVLRVFSSNDHTKEKPSFQTTGCSIDKHESGEISPPKSMEKFHLIKPSGDQYFFASQRDQIDSWIAVLTESTLYEEDGDDVRNFKRVDRTLAKEIGEGKLPDDGKRKTNEGRKGEGFLETAPPLVKKSAIAGNAVHEHSASDNGRRSDADDSQNISRNVDCTTSGIASAATDTGKSSLSEDENKYKKHRSDSSSSSGEISENSIAQEFKKESVKNLYSRFLAPDWSQAEQNSPYYVSENISPKRWDSTGEVPGRARGATDAFSMKGYSEANNHDKNTESETQEGAGETFQQQVYASNAQREHKRYTSSKNSKVYAKKSPPEKLHSFEALKGLRKKSSPEFLNQKFAAMSDDSSKSRQTPPKSPNVGARESSFPRNRGNVATAESIRNCPVRREFCDFENDQRYQSSPSSDTHERHAFTGHNQGTPFRKDLHSIKTKGLNPSSTKHLTVATDASGDPLSRRQVDDIPDSFGYNQSPSCPRDFRDTGITRGYRSDDVVCNSLTNMQTEDISKNDGTGTHDEELRTRFAPDSADYASEQNRVPTTVLNWNKRPKFCNFPETGEVAGESRRFQRSNKRPGIDNLAKIIYNQQDEESPTTPVRKATSSGTSAVSSIDKSDSSVSYVKDSENNHSRHSTADTVSPAVQVSNMHLADITSSHPRGVGDNSKTKTEPHLSPQKSGESMRHSKSSSQDSFLRTPETKKEGSVTNSPAFKELIDFLHSDKPSRSEPRSKTNLVEVTSCNELPVVSTATSVETHDHSNIELAHDSDLLDSVQNSDTAISPDHSTAPMEGGERHLSPKADKTVENDVQTAMSNDDEKTGIALESVTEKTHGRPIVISTNVSSFSVQGCVDSASCLSNNYLETSNNLLINATNGLTEDNEVVSRVSSSEYDIWGDSKEQNHVGAIVVGSSPGADSRDKATSVQSWEHSDEENADTRDFPGNNEPREIGHGHGQESQHQDASTVQNPPGQDLSSSVLHRDSGNLVELWERIAPDDFNDKKTEAAGSVDETVGGSTSAILNSEKKETHWNYEANRMLAESAKLASSDVMGSPDKDSFVEPGDQNADSTGKVHSHNMSAGSYSAQFQKRKQRPYQPTQIRTPPRDTQRPCHDADERLSIHEAHLGRWDAEGESDGSRDGPQEPPLYTNGISVQQSAYPREASLSKWQVEENEDDFKNHHQETLFVRRPASGISLQQSAHRQESGGRPRKKKRKKRKLQGKNKLGQPVVQKADESGRCSPAEISTAKPISNALAHTASSLASGENSVSQGSGGIRHHVDGAAAIIEHQPRVPSTGRKLVDATWTVLQELFHGTPSHQPTTDIGNDRYGTMSNRVKMSLLQELSIEQIHEPRSEPLPCSEGNHQARGARNEETVDEGEYADFELLSRIPIQTSTMTPRDKPINDAMAEKNSFVGNGQDEGDEKRCDASPIHSYTVETSRLGKNNISPQEYGTNHPVVRTSRLPDSEISLPDSSYYDNLVVEGSIDEDLSDWLVCQGCYHCAPKLIKAGITKMSILKTCNLSHLLALGMHKSEAQRIMKKRERQHYYDEYSRNWGATSGDDHSSPRNSKASSVTPEKGRQMAKSRIRTYRSSNSPDKILRMKVLTDHRREQKKALSDTDTTDNDSASVDTAEIENKIKEIQGRLSNASLLHKWVAHDSHEHLTEPIVQEGPNTYHEFNFPLREKQDTPERFEDSGTFSVAIGDGTQLNLTDETKFRNRTAGGGDHQNFNVPNQPEEYSNTAESTTGRKLHRITPSPSLQKWNNVNSVSPDKASKNIVHKRVQQERDRTEKRNPSEPRVASAHHTATSSLPEAPPGVPRPQKPKPSD